jgi:hypothetical protein
MSDAICHQCGKPLPATARRHARFCSPAHRAAYHRASTAAKMARVVAIVPDERFPGMYRLKRTDGSLSDMVNLTRAKDALAAVCDESKARAACNAVSGTPRDEILVPAVVRF